MTLHRLFRTQNLPISLEQAWDFFSSPANLDAITPPEMGFRILGGIPPKMFEGQIIAYRIRVAPGVWVSWVTEIKSVEEKCSFIDEQRFGPYRFWHHRHTFEAIEGGVRMTDEIHYVVPFGPLGEVVHPFAIRPKLERIFQFRHDELLRRFGAIEDQDC